MTVTCKSVHEYEYMYMLPGRAQTAEARAQYADRCTIYLKQ